MQFTFASPLLMLPFNAIETGKPKHCVTAGNSGLKKEICRVMKLSSIFLFIACLHVQAAGYGQGITLSEKDAPIGKIFEKIRKQTGYQFFYNNVVVQSANRVTIHVKGASIDEVLKKCFENQPLIFTIKDKTIIIRKKNVVSTTPSSALNIDISGKIVDDAGNPLAGASIRIVGTNVGTNTDNEGNFLLQNVKENAFAQISFIGYETVTIPIRNQRILNITLAKKTSILDETVVIAYGSTTKRLNTGSVSSVKRKDIETLPTNNPLLTMQGRVSGMQVTQSSGLPGSGITVRIRGQNSIQFGNDPLYIIDGVPFTSQLLSNLGDVLGRSEGALPNSGAGNPFSFINTADIESIEVLKDADATAIYGSRGANGVVLITTKKGKAGKLKADVSIQTGWGSLQKKMTLLDSKQYLQMRKEALQNDATVAGPMDFDLNIWDSTRNTDWQQELLGKTANYTNAQVSLSGGSENVQFLIGTGYTRETTVFPGDQSDQKNFVHFSLNSSSRNQKLKLSLSGLYTRANRRLPSTDLTSLALTLPPNAPAMTNADSTINWAINPSTGFSTWTNGFFNPATILLTKYKSSTNNLIANSVVSYEIAKGLEIKTSFGFNTLNTDEVRASPLVKYEPAVRSLTPRSSSFVNNKITSWIIEPQVTYQKALNKGELNVLVGASIQQSKNDNKSFEGVGFINDLLIEDIRSASTIYANTIQSLYKYSAVFARINYSLNNTLLVNATARRDGTSRFISSERFHNFGALGLGWVFTQHTLFKDKVPFLSFGKLRTSYGTTGNDQVGDYSFMDLYQSLTVGVPYQGAVGLRTYQIYTPELEWEETRKFEVGLELGIFNDKIFLTSNYYRNNTTNQLLDYTIPSIAGFTTVKRNLPAQVINSGFEFELRSVNLKNSSITWNTNFNLSLNRNKLDKGAAGLSDLYTKLIGSPLNSRYVYRYLGVNPTTGLYEIADKEGKAVDMPSEADATELIDLTPRFFGGIQNSFTYKGFQLDFLFEFVKQKAQQYLYNYIPGTIYGGNQPEDVINRWEKPGDIAENQRFNQDFSVIQPWLNVQRSTQLFGDASYIRLRNASLSYQFNPGILKRISFNSLRLFVQGQNLVTFTNYNGIDPETKNGTSLPPLRIVTIGTQMQF